MLLGWAGGEDAAGDGSCLFPHLRRIRVRAQVPEFHSCMVENPRQARRRRRLAHQRALLLGDALQPRCRAGISTSRMVILQVDDQWPDGCLQARCAAEWAELTMQGVDAVAGWAAHGDDFFVLALCDCASMG